MWTAKSVRARTAVSVVLGSILFPVTRRLSAKGISALRALERASKKVQKRGYFEKFEKYCKTPQENTFQIYHYN
jgi:hypothetical protein